MDRGLGDVFGESLGVGSEILQRKQVERVGEFSKALASEKKEKKRKSDYNCFSKKEGKGSINFEAPTICQHFHRFFISCNPHCNTVK